MTKFECILLQILIRKTHWIYEDITIFVLSKAICDIKLEAIVQPYQEKKRGGKSEISQDP
jgi:hypothetical protein